MSGDVAFEKVNEAKASMDHIYNQPDPRAYFRELKKLYYRIPGSAKLSEDGHAASAGFFFPVLRAIFPHKIWVVSVLWVGIPKRFIQPLFQLFVHVSLASLSTCHGRL